MKNRLILLSFVLLLTTIVVFLLKENNNFDPISKSYSFETFKVDDGWGYKILKNDKIFIKQNFIPAVKGNLSFITEQEANVAAKFVIKKINQHKLPTITVKELNNMDITIHN